MKLSDREFFRIVHYVRMNFGVNLIRKRLVIEKRLGEYIVDKKYDSYDTFMDQVEKDKSKELSNALIERVTINHTFFMREPEHFELLKKIILPSLTGNEDTGDIRIWSAASSSGQEAYTIGMIMLDFFSLCGEKKAVSILASDVSRKVLQQARSGEFSEEQMAAVSEEWKNKYFIKKLDGSYKAVQELLEMVECKQINLLDPIHLAYKCHVIFARNVLIYFNTQTINQVVDKLADHLEPGGYLFVGLTETLDIQSSKLVCVQPSVYRKI